MVLMCFLVIMLTVPKKSYIRERIEIEISMKLFQ
jgi:hypothetical protein